MDNAMTKRRSFIYSIHEVMSVCLITISNIRSMRIVTARGTHPDHIPPQPPTDDKRQATLWWLCGYRRAGSIACFSA